MNENNITTRRSENIARSDKRKTDIVKPDKFDGSASWIDFKSHFEVCAELNKWTFTEKGMYLAVALRGQAQSVLGNLPVGDRCNYRLLSNALEERFLPPNQTELYRAQLRERRQRASESLPELGQDLRRLVNLAYPTAPIEVRETLAKEQFIDALKESEMRLRVKQARPMDLNDAIRHAVELDAFNSAERRLNESKGYLREVKPQEKAETGDTITSLLKAVQDIKKEMKELKMKVEKGNDNKPYSTVVGCNFCKKKGHVKTSCLKYQRMMNDNIQNNQT